MSSRAKTPTVLQLEATECGAAALGIILGYYGRWVPLTELRQECGVSRDGSRASRIVEAARRYGLEADGWRKELSSLRDVPTPFIVFWNFNHFLVIEGFSKDKVYLNDPAEGPRKVAWEELDQAFTGVVLTFSPSAEFERRGVRPSTMRALTERLRGSKRTLLYLVLVGLALAVPGLVVPVFTKIYVDNILIEGLTGWLRPLLLAMSVTALTIGVLTWLQQYYLLRTETRLAISSAGRFLWHVLRLPMDFFSQRTSGDLASRVALNDQVAALLAGDLATTMLNLIVAVFYAVLMLFYDPVLTAVGVTFAIFNLLTLRYVARKRVDDNQRLANEEGKLMGTAMIGLHSIETLKASGAESDFFSRWAGYFAKVLNAQQGLARSSLLLSVVPVLLSSLNTVLILGIGGLRVMDGILTVGMLMAFHGLMLSFTAPVTGLVGLAGNLQSVIGYVNRLDDVLRHDPDPSLRQPRDAPTRSAFPKLTGSLELRDVTFGYSPRDPPLISGMSLRLEPGSRVALVGASGSGKSTVAKLVMGLYQPWSGQILFDDRTRAEVAPESLHESLSMVDQELVLFEGSVRDNLTLWDPTVAERDLIRAARDAEIHDVITSRSGGYDSYLRENGRNMSGGQLQRLEIARALVRNPSILVLDEATSSLDPLTETKIDDHLRRRGCTCLIVAHRLSTIRDCDEILVMHAGKVVERGGHDELRDRGGAYSRLMAD